MFAGNDRGAQKRSGQGREEKKGDQAKVAIRNVRRDANDSIKKLLKNSEISEDEQKQYEEKIQKMTDKFIEKVDKEIDVKSKEILTV